MGERRDQQQRAGSLNGDAVTFAVPVVVTNVVVDEWHVRPRKGTNRLCQMAEERRQAPMYDILPTRKNGRLEHIYKF